jgi:hypothetical protein
MIRFELSNIGYNQAMKKFKEIEQYFHQSVEKQMKSKKGKIVAIDPATKKYFLGNDEIEAYLQATKSNPGVKPFYFRVGYKSTHFIGSM